jgi:putative membrane protein
MKTKMTANTWKIMSLALVASGITTVALAQDNNNNSAQLQNTPSRSTAGQNPPSQSAPADNNNNLPPQNLPERMINAITAQQFVSDAAIGGMKEVRLSEIALDKSQNPQIRDFATRMVRDHSEANNKLTQIAQQKGLELPATNTFAMDDPNWNNSVLNGSDQVKEGYLLNTRIPVAAYQDFKHLKSLSGKEFDDAYVQDMVGDHITTIHEFEVAQRNLTDPELRQFATTTLPTLRMHSEMAQRLENEQVGTPTSASPNGQYAQPTRAQQLQQQEQQQQQQQSQPSDIGK